MWTILTCEYPPGCGGVGDYTAQVAAALAAAGDDVTVFTPPTPSDVPTVTERAEATRPSKMNVIALPDRYGPRSRAELDRWLEGRNTTLLVQYVPTAFGMRGANIPWCRWFEARTREHHGDVRVMFHEPYYEFTWEPLHQNVLALAQRTMAGSLLRAATQTYISTDAWHPYLEPYRPASAAPSITLPIPSAIPKCDRLSEVDGLRRQFLGGIGGRLTGHFGTYGSHIAPMLRAALESLLSDDAEIVAVCIGAGSEAFVRALIEDVPALAGRLHATGRTSPFDTALALAACDLLLQPYFDGVTTRRTSVMAGLINGRPILTTTGHLTESLWAESRPVALTPANDVRSFVGAAHNLLADQAERTALGARAERIYRERFALSHTIDRLRGVVQGAAA